jgi:hypothetical protein
MPTLGPMRGLAIGCVLLGNASACGGGSAALSPNSGTAVGVVDGDAWTTIKNAYWLGKPIIVNPTRPIVIQLYDAPIECSMLRLDTQLPATTHVLQLGLSDTAVKRSAVPGDAYASYWKGGFLPDADGGTITVTAVAEGMHIAGTFDVQFRADRLSGTFDAKFCPNGSQPQ